MIITIMIDYLPPPSAKGRAQGGQSPPKTPQGPPTPGPGGFGEGFALPKLGLWPRGMGVLDFSIILTRGISHTHT